MRQCFRVVVGGQDGLVCNYGGSFAGRTRW